MVQLAVTIAPLEIDEVDLAYPLVSLGDGPPSLESWRALAIKAVQGQAEGRLCGVMAARRRRQIRGLFTYEVSATVSPSILCIGHLSVSEPLDSLIPWDRLLWAIVELGQQHNCAAVHIGLPPDRSWLLDRWPDPEALANPIAVACTVRRARPVPTLQTQ
ncbi:MAG: hypothetical protein HQ495_13955 [Alphaproteobacteria bacterium]|nr:hypothetical protein [Alphaproteobacteria bacterium]